MFSNPNAPTERARVIDQTGRVIPPPAPTINQYGQLIPPPPIEPEPQTLGLAASPVDLIGGGLIWLLTAGLGAAMLWNYGFNHHQTVTALLFMLPFVGCFMWGLETLPFSKDVATGLVLGSVLMLALAVYVMASEGWNDGLAILIFPGVLFAFAMRIYDGSLTAADELRGGAFCWALTAFLAWVVIAQFHHDEITVIVAGIAFLICGIGAFKLAPPPVFLTIPLLIAAAALPVANLLIMQRWTDETFLLLVPLAALLIFEYSYEQPFTPAPAPKIEGGPIDHFREKSGQHFGNAGFGIAAQIDAAAAEGKPTNKPHIFLN